MGTMEVEREDIKDLFHYPVDFEGHLWEQKLWGS